MKARNLNNSQSIILTKWYALSPDEMTEIAELCKRLGIRKAKFYSDAIREYVKKCNDKDRL